MNNYVKHAEFWPQDIERTVVLSTITIHYTRSSSEHSVPQQGTITTQSVYENERHPNHTERRCLDDLIDKINGLTVVGCEVRKVEAKLVQNYSPCYTCSDRIIQFQNNLDDIADLTIKFANFYLHQVPENKGLKNLLQKPYKIGIQGEVEWEAFLNDETFVDLTDYKSAKKCWLRHSDKREETENVDREILCRLNLPRDDP